MRWSLFNNKEKNSNKSLGLPERYEREKARIKDLEQAEALLLKIHKLREKGDAKDEQDLKIYETRWATYARNTSEWYQILEGLHETDKYKAKIEPIFSHLCVELYNYCFAMQDLASFKPSTDLKSEMKEFCIAADPYLKHKSPVDDSELGDRSKINVVDSELRNWLNFIYKSEQDKKYSHKNKL